jgi:hypothetical protein
MAQLPFPLSFKRQFAGPLEADTVFATQAELDGFLSSPLRYAGQVVTCLETEGVAYVLSNDLSAWVPISGGEGSGEGAASVPIKTADFEVADNTSVVAVDELNITDTLIVDGNLAVI